MFAIVGLDGTISIEAAVASMPVKFARSPATAILIVCPCPSVDAAALPVLCIVFPLALIFVNDFGRLLCTAISANDGELPSTMPLVVDPLALVRRGARRLYVSPVAMSCAIQIVALV